MEVGWRPVLLNDSDRATGPADYGRLIAWLRGIAVAACRSAAARWPVDRHAYIELHREFEVSIPALSSVTVAPAGADFMAALARDAAQPARRNVLLGTSLTEIAEAMGDATARRERARYRDA